MNTADEVLDKVLASANTIKPTRTRLVYGGPEAILRYVQEKSKKVSYAIINIVLGSVLGLVIGASTTYYVALVLCTIAIAVFKNHQYDKSIMHIQASQEWLSMFLLSAFPTEAPSSKELLSAGCTVCPNTGKFFIIDINETTTLIYVYPEMNLEATPERIVDVEEFRSFDMVTYKKFVKSNAR